MIATAAIPKPPPKSDAKQQAKKAQDFLFWIADELPLTDDEADALKDNLIMGLEALWQGTDELITKSNKKQAEAYIWQTIDAEDTEFLADGMIRIAKKNKAAAWAVRGIAESSAKLRAGIILLPRFVDSVRFYAGNGGLVLPL